MRGVIIKHHGWYFVYSRCSDAVEPQRAFTLEELREAYREEYGNQGMLELRARLARVEEKGTSGMDDRDVEDAMSSTEPAPARRG